MNQANVINAAATQADPAPSCPAGCCTGNEILCVSIPCPVDIVLLGLRLQLNLPCLSLSSPTALTAAQVTQLLQVVQNLLGSLGTIV